MDEARRFRFLVPPFFLVLSIGAGMYFSGLDFGESLKSYSKEQLAILGAIIGASVLPAGFLLTSFSILVLRMASLVVGGRTYEAAVSDESWARIWPLLRTTLPPANRWHLYAAATFDHELLPPKIHEWIQRRWSTFNLSVHSFAAVALSHLATVLPAVHETCPWVLITAVLLLIFGTTASIAWLQTMRMLEFQALRQSSVFHSPANTPPRPTSGTGASG